MLSERGKQDDARRSLRGFTRAPPFRRPARTPPTDWSGIHYLGSLAIRSNWHDGAEPFIRSAGAKQFGPKLNPFITLTEEEALKTAAVLDAELGRDKPRGPLHGIPIVYKDNIDTAGTRTTMGSEFFSKRMPDDDAHVVNLLKNAGAVMIAKANMNEFAAGVAGRNKHFGNAVNPWDTTCWPGGSSSGTGVAIASGLCLGGLGTDTGISIRGPAGWLGLVGVRPSYGRVSVRGVFPRAYSFDTVGPIAPTVADAAALLQAIANYDEKDKYAVRAPRQTSPPN